MVVQTTLPLTQDNLYSDYSPEFSSLFYKFEKLTILGVEYVLKWVGGLQFEKFSHIMKGNILLLLLNYILISQQN